MLEFDRHAANELALSLINENTGAFPYHARLNVPRRPVNEQPHLWVATMEHYAASYRREWKLPPFAPSTILAAAAEVADYYERHVAELAA